MRREEWDNLKSGDKVRIAIIDGGWRDQRKKTERPPCRIVGRVVEIVSRTRDFDQFMVKFDGRRYRFRSSEFVDPKVPWIDYRSFGQHVETWIERDYDNWPVKVRVNWSAIGPTAPKLAEKFARQMLSAISYARSKNRQIAKWKKGARLGQG